MIRVDSLRPSAPLAGIVESHTVYAGVGSREALQRVFPGSAIELTLNLSDGEVRCYDPATFHQNRARGPLLTGLFSRYYVIDTAQLGDMLSVRLRPGGAWRLFGVPLNQAADRHVGLADLLGRRGEEMLHRIADHADPVTRVRTLEAFLVERGLRSLHPAVDYALYAVRRRGVRPRALEIARESGLSFRRFNELFLREVGLTLKAFLRLQRFEQVVAHARATPNLSWSQTAADFGFADQAHLIRDFQTFAGYTPAQFLQTLSRKEQTRRAHREPFG